MELVCQKDGSGCGIACCAMVAGRSYDEIKNLIGTWAAHNGTNEHALWVVLSHLGFACRLLYARNWEGQWPPKSEHAMILSMPTPTCNHYVVYDGVRVYDPEQDSLQWLTDYDPAVHAIVTVPHMDN